MPLVRGSEGSSSKDVSRGDFLLVEEREGGGERTLAELRCARELGGEY